MIAEGIEASVGARSGSARRPATAESPVTTPEIDAKQQA